MNELPEPRTPRGPHVSAGGVRHDAGDMSVTAAADVTLGEVQSRLAEAGQWLALDGDAATPLGELAAHDSTGPLRLGYGGWRDMLTGVQYDDADGELVTAGGVTVKNVAGYDLVKFMVGSHGCFGTIRTLTLRAYRRPKAALAATLPASAADDLSPLLAADAPPQWALLTPDGLRLGWLGRAREIDRLEPLLRANGLDAQRRTLEEDEAERAASLDFGRRSLRVDVAPGQVRSVVAGWPSTPFAADPVVGRIWTGWEDEEALSGLRPTMRATGGYGTWRDAEHGVVRTLGVPRDTWTVLRALKKKLDPRGRLPPLPIEE